MVEIESDKIADVQDELRELTSAALQQIPFELFERRGRKTSKLLMDADVQASIEGRHRWYEFTLTEVTLVDNITVHASGYGGFDQFEFQWSDEKGGVHKAHADVASGKVTLKIQNLCRGFAFRPPMKILAWPRIDLVSIEGVTRKRIPEALSTIANVEDRVNSANASISQALANASLVVQAANEADARKESVETEIAELEEESEELRGAISALQSEKANWISEKGNAERDIKRALDRLNDLEGQNKTKTSERENLTNEVTQKTAELQQLKNDINIFPSELSSFADQGARAVQLYFLLALIPIIIIAYLFAMLLSGGEELSTIFTKDQNYNITAVLLSRLPYVTIAVALLAACYKISKAFLEETVRINRQRLNLTKISIIAKDVTFASADGLNLDDDEIFQRRTELKMALLRDHLKSYLSDDPKLGLPKSIGPRVPLLVDPDTTIKDIVEQYEGAEGEDNEDEDEDGRA